MKKENLIKIEATGGILKPGTVAWVVLADRPNLYQVLYTLSNGRKFFIANHALLWMRDGEFKVIK